MYKTSFIPVVPRISSVHKTFAQLPVEYIKGDYERNIYGFIRSDFAVLQDSEDSLSMARTLQKMQEIAANEPDNSDKSFEDIVREIRPRWCQLPAEMDRFELYCINNALDTYSKLKKLDDEQKEALRQAAGKHESDLIESIRSKIDGGSVSTVSSKVES